MARKEALEKLLSRLIAQRNALSEKVLDELGLALPDDDGINDIGEAALLVERAELHTQLAALESRELAQIDQAIQRIRDGKYGICIECERPIPVVRLQALPFASTCIECRRDADRTGRSTDDSASWRRAMDLERRASDPEAAAREIALER